METGEIITIVMAAMTFVYGVVIGLIVYIWNQRKKNVDKIHQDLNQIAKELTKKSNNQDVMVGKLTVLVDALDGRMTTTEGDIKRLEDRTNGL